MLDRFLSMTVLAQATPAPPGGPAGPAGSVFTLLPFLLIGVLFYFLLVVPERRKARDLEQMLKAIKKNDRVVTSGGILGLVVNAPKDSDEVVIRVDENNNTRLHVLRSAIVRVLASDGAGESKEA